MAEEQNSQPVAPQPVVAQPVVAQPVVAPAPATAPQQAPVAPAKKSNVWIWILGGCLTILILIGIVVMALGWWAARKVKNAIKENQPKLEQMQKDAEEWSKNAEEWQKQAEDFQKSMPDPDDFQVPAN